MEGSTRRLVLGAAIGLAFSALASPATAGQGGCTQDLAKFCAKVPAGEGRQLACLKEHESELSEACRNSALLRGKTAKPHPLGPCRADAERLCKSVEPGEGRVVNCLDAHASELSDACKAYRSQKKAGAESPPQKAKAE
jgi:hypothetical protein